jgi:N-acyl homoserine lactone hydrolase
MKMHVLSGGRLRMRMSVYYPDAAKTDLIELPVSCFLLRHAQGNVLFDSGCNPQSLTDPEGCWGGMSRFLTNIGGPDDNVISQLAMLGLAGDDIDLVVSSHLHTDHCGCNAYFKKARMLCHARERDAACADDAEAKGYLRRDWDVGREIGVFDGQCDLFGDGKIVLLPLPGHTPGSIGALIQLEKSGRYLLGSDAVSMRECLTQELVPKNTVDHETFVASLREIATLHRSGVEVIFGHDDRQWQALKKGVEFYD